MMSSTILRGAGLRRVARAAAPAFVLAALLGATTASAQVTDAQRSAIRAACRSDFMSNCSGVQPGGAAAFQCLQQNMARLSPACKSAVSAVEPAKTEAPKAAEPVKTESSRTETPKTESSKTETPKMEAPKAETAPAREPAPVTPKAAAAKPAATRPAPSAAPQASDAQRSAIRAACRSDFMANCSGVQPGGEAAFQCLQQHAARLSPACKSAVSAVSPQQAPKSATARPAAPSAPPVAAAPASPPLMLRPLRPLEEMRVLRLACGPDARVLCGDVQPGGGRIVQCLAMRPDALSPACRDVLGEFAADR